MITSLGNRGVKSVVHLRERAKVRREQEAFVTEGIRMFLEAPAERKCIFPNPFRVVWTARRARNQMDTWQM